MNFKPVIDRHIAPKRWTYADLARAAGIRNCVVSTLVNNKVSPSLVTLIKIAKALKVDVWKLIREAEKAEKQTKGE